MLCLLRLGRCVGRSCWQVVLTREAWHRGESIPCTCRQLPVAVRWPLQRHLDARTSNIKGVEPVYTGDRLVTGKACAKVCRACDVSVPVPR
jgi:hypothetical protein